MKKPVPIQVRVFFISGSLLFRKKAIFAITLHILQHKS